MTGRENAERICALVIDREPTTLRELEDILGCTLPRDSRDRQPWKLGARRPVLGIRAVHVMFRACDLDVLVADPDPPIEDYDLAVVGAVELATAMLGPSDADVWIRGTGSFQMTKQRLGWTRRYLTATTRAADAEDALLEELAALVDGPLTWSHLEAVCGAFDLDGRRECLRADRETWLVFARPNPRTAVVPDLCDVVIQPTLPCDRLFATLGWHDVIVTSSTVFDGSTRAYPRTSYGHGVLVQLAKPTVDLAPDTPYAVARRHGELGAKFFQVRK